MQLTKVKKGFIMRDRDLKINFTSYEYSSILKDVSLYRNGVLVAIYENVEKFEEQIKRC
jgi:hypothetical protein